MLSYESPILKSPGVVGNAHVDEDTKAALKAVDVRLSSMVAAKIVANALRPSLGKNGKMEQAKCKSGAEMLSKLNIEHPAGKMLVDTSKKQQARAADGTTSAVIIAGALLEASGRLITKGVPTSAITASFHDASDRAVKILEEVSRPVEDDVDALIQLGKENSDLKSEVLTRVAVESIMELKRQNTSPEKVNLAHVQTFRHVGSKISDTKVVKGLVLERTTKRDMIPTSGPVEVQNATIALMDYWMSPSKATSEEMMKEERKRILNECKQIKKLGTNVVLILKSDLDVGQVDVNLQICLHFFAKMNIMAIADICIDDVENISRCLGCHLAGHPDTITPDKLGSAYHVSGDKIVKFTGLTKGANVAVMLHGPSESIVNEAERTVRNIQLFLRTLIKKQSVIAGGGAAETEAALRLKQHAQSIGGLRSECVKAFADALEVIPYTLAENANMDPVEAVKDLRRKHAFEGKSGYGVAMKQGVLADMYEASVVQPLLVPTSAIELAAETVSKILKVTDLDAK